MALDELKIRSAFLSKLIGKIIKKQISKKFGIKPEISILELDVKNNDVCYTAHLDLNATMSKEELTTLLSNLKLTD